ncbi:MAG TPA: preprotein translocase subunit SecE [Anaerolineae bacterium]|nr:preprotein translocase subunit SecE [Anaerolineae bacterium]
MAKGKARSAKRSAKKPNRIISYVKEVRAELRRVVWPSRRTTINLTAMVFGVTVVMSVAMGLADWILSKLFALIIG